MDYRYGSHTVYNIEYHFVWVTKYRYKVLIGDVALRVRALVRQTCEIFEIKILTGVVSKDHARHHVSMQAETILPRLLSGHCQLIAKTAHACSKERTPASFALSRTAVFSSSAHHQIPSKRRRPPAIFP